MDEPGSGARWDAGFSAGKYAYLHKPAEQARLAEIAAMIARAGTGPFEIVDIGCGEGLLLHFLDQGRVARYVGVDISAVALSRLPVAALPTLAVNAALGDWGGGPPALAPRIVVASEVLYYSPTAVADLARAIRAEPATAGVIVSCVAERADKPNWGEASRRLWAELGETGWTADETRRVSDGATSWDLALYRI